MTDFSVIKIDPEFKALIPPLSAEEYAQLEANILAEGCRDALVLWSPEPFGEQTLLDGHNRYAICQQHGYEYNIQRLGADLLPDRQSAINWIINNQLGRRNLHPDQASYLRGKRYNGEKQDHGGQVKGSRDQNDPSIERTADRLATEYKVSAPTIKRDGQYAAAVDTLQAAGIEPQSIIAHETKAAVVEFAKAITPEPELPPTPLLPAEPPKPKDPLITEVTEKVKRGEMTVTAAAKQIEKMQKAAIIQDLQERLPKAAPKPPALPPKPDPVFETVLPNGKKIAEGDPKALWLWGWLLECEDRFLSSAPAPDVLASNFLDFMTQDSQRLIPKITHYLNQLLEVVHEPVA